MILFEKFSSSSSSSATTRLTYALIVVYIVANVPTIYSTLIGFIVNIQWCQAVDNCDVNMYIKTKSSVYAGAILTELSALRYAIDPIIAFIVD